MSVGNPTWLQGVFYLGILFFPFLTLYCFFLAFNAFFNSSVLTVMVFLLCGLFLAYITYMGMILAKYVSAKVDFDDFEFSVEVRGVKKTYEWKDVAKVKNYKIAQILMLTHSSGETIFVVDHLTPGYGAFSKKLFETLALHKSQ